MSTAEEQDLQEFMDLRAKIKQLESALQVSERTIELLAAAGHVTEDQVEKARELAISLTGASGPQEMTE